MTVRGAPTSMGRSPPLWANQPIHTRKDAARHQWTVLAMPTAPAATSVVLLVELVLLRPLLQRCERRLVPPSRFAPPAALLRSRDTSIAICSAVEWKGTPWSTPHRRTYSNGGAAANGARHSRAANGDELSELSAKIVAQRRRASSARLSPVAGNGARAPTPTRREWWAACLPCWAG